VSARVLVAGLGNVFFGDDGFGVEVARALSRAALPPGTVVREVGTRTLHLAYELADGWDRLIVVDALARGGPPGTLYVIEPTDGSCVLAHAPDAHGMSLAAILDTARGLGARLPEVFVVGCEVEDVSAGMGLTAAVEAAVEAAVAAVLPLAAPRNPLPSPVAAEEAGTGCVARQMRLENP